MQIPTSVHDNLFRHTECNALGRYTFRRTYFLLFEQIIYAFSAVQTILHLMAIQVYFTILILILISHSQDGPSTTRPVLKSLRFV